MHKIFDSIQSLVSKSSKFIKKMITELGEIQHLPSCTTVESANIYFFNMLFKLHRIFKRIMTENIGMNKNLPWSSILFLLMLLPLGSCCNPKIPLILYAPDLGSGNCVLGACAITETGPPVDPTDDPPLVATWCACLAFSAALFLTIL